MEKVRAEKYAVDFAKTAIEAGLFGQNRGEALATNVADFIKTLAERLEKDLSVGV